MTKPWEKFDKTTNSEAETEAETEDDGGLSFDMGASVSEEIEDDSDALDFSVDASESNDAEPLKEEPSEMGFSLDDVVESTEFEKDEEETAATRIFSKDSDPLEELTNASVDNEEDLEKTINKIVGLGNENGIDFDMPEDDPTVIKSKLPGQPKLNALSSGATDESDVFSLGDSEDQDDDAATRIFTNAKEKLNASSTLDLGIDESDPNEVDVASMFGDGEDSEDAATRVLQINKTQLNNDSENSSLAFGGLDNSDFQAQEEEDLGGVPVREPRMSTLSSDELVRLQATIRQLRTERGDLLNEISSLKQGEKVLESDNLGLKAELDEIKIELTILKKRKSSEVDDIIYQNELANEKKEILEEKNKHLQKEFDRLNQKVRVDFNQVKQREKELESQLELVSMDGESQVRSRDVKILELKRHIDQLEFNMENASIKEQKSRDDKVKLEDKLSKVIKSLRNSMNLIEDGIDYDLDSAQKIKKL